MPFIDQVAMDAFARFNATLFDEREVMQIPTGFQAFFGNPDNGGLTHFSPDANAVDIDIIRADRRTAAFIPRGIVSRTLGSNQRNMQTGAFSSFSRKFPLSEEEGDISADEILFRMAGESPYSTRTRLDRMRERAYKIHMASVRRTVGLFERLAATSILTGFQPAILGTTNADLLYDFRRRPTHTWATLNKWNAVGADILGDIDDACDLIEQDGGLLPDFMGLGGDILNTIINDATVQTVADNRRFELIEVSLDNPVPERFVRFVKAGWNARGCLRTPKGYTLWMFTNKRTFENEAGADERFMPEGAAFLTSSLARFDRYFGPPESLPNTAMRVELYQELFGFNPRIPPLPVNIQDPGAVILPNMFYCDAYASADWKKVTIRTQSAPIFATTQTDAIVRFTNLI